jgi:hypothetical protein
MLECRYVSGEAFSRRRRAAFEARLAGEGLDGGRLCVEPQSQGQETLAKPWSAGVPPRKTRSSCCISHLHVGRCHSRSPNPGTVVGVDRPANGPVYPSWHAGFMAAHGYDMGGSQLLWRPGCGGAGGQAKACGVFFIGQKVLPPTRTPGEPSTCRSPRCDPRGGEKVGKTQQPTPLPSHRTALMN